MKDRSKILTITLVIITIIVVVLSLLLKKEDEIKENPINIVTNYSDFYTVNSCLYRTINYISAKDSNSLLLLFSDNYKKENKIDEDNIINLFGNVDPDSTFVSRKMYYQKLNDNITKYFVYGYLEKNQLLGDDSITLPDNKDMYFIVYLDRENSIFQIEPYSGDIFIGGDVDGE